MKPAHRIKKEHHIAEAAHNKTWEIQQWSLDHDKILKTTFTAITLTLLLFGGQAIWNYQQKPAKLTSEQKQTSQPSETTTTPPVTREPSTNQQNTTLQSCAETSEKIIQSPLPLEQLTAEITAAKTLCAPSRYEKIIAYKQLQAATK